MEKRELKVLYNYYYSNSKTPIIWYEEMFELHKKNNIFRIYEIVDDKYNEIWYMVRTKDYQSYIINPKYGNIKSADMMEKFKKYYKFNRFNSKVIYMYDSGIYPIVYKINNKNFNEIYNRENNKTISCYNHFYCENDGYYEAVRIYRNKNEYEIFENEEDAILWLSEMDKTKNQINDIKVRPYDLYERVYDYTKENIELEI